MNKSERDALARFLGESTDDQKRREFEFIMQRGFQNRKDVFMKTEIGNKIIATLKIIDDRLCKGDSETARQFVEKWSIHSEYLKMILGETYYFTRTDEYFGAVTEDETDWLYKEERKIEA